MADYVRVMCLRHAEAENIIAGAAGQLPLAPLTPDGRAQAAAAAHALRGEPITQIYASTALRASQTAGIIGDLLHLDVVELPELVEVGIGTQEGAVDPVTRARTAEVLRAWVVERDLDQRVADGESGHEVIARVSFAFEAIASAHPGDTVAVVGHVASLTAGLSTLCHLGDQVWGAPLPPATPFLVQRDEPGWRCEAWPGRSD